MDERYRSVLWRKRLEQKGWISLRRRTPNGRIIEFHVIYKGQLYSGRCHVSQLHEDAMKPGAMGYLLGRPDLIREGVWRRARNPEGELGMVRLPWRP